MGTLNIEDIKKLLDDQTDHLRENFKKEIGTLRTDVKKRDEKISFLEKRSLFLERKIRKNNIIIFGLNINENNIVRETIEKLNQLLELNFSLSDINNIYQLGKHEKAPIIVEFISYLKKIEIFQNVEKLKSLKGANISLSNDLCEIDRKNHKILRKHYKIAKEKNLQTKIQGFRIEIENKWYTVDELEESYSESDVSNEGTDDEEMEEEDESDIEKLRKNGMRQIAPNSDQQPSISRKNKIGDNLQTAQKRKKTIDSSPPIRSLRRKKKK
ncbi:unnamed protein product [Psylliodes chrysocephalus]|uniref:Uncharacterized protein n=1 Tax=Psylliodes chrysocephalus TaxID=3402493 RepID=A0A9P0GAP1_9CUCU|nr:unnamed protein product [Psylliodes chrysocephala]